MPVGVIVNGLSVLLGGAAGALVGKGLKQDWKDKLTLIMGCCSMCIGIQSIILMVNMPAVVFSVIIGTVIGILLQLSKEITGAARWAESKLSRKVEEDPDRTNLLVTAVVLFCASGTGIYGSIVSGMTGDNSILIAKSILDFFTAMIFACNLGSVVSAVSVPQVLIFLVLFFLGGPISRVADETMICDFKACGGFIMLATGFRIAGICPFSVADMLPAMILVMPVSRLWTTVIQPLVAALAG